jgi:hypothetical protein
MPPPAPPPTKRDPAPSHRAGPSSPYHFVKDEGVLGTVDMCTHLVEIHLRSSLGLHPFSGKVGFGLDQGLLGNPCLLLPCSEGLLPLCQLLLRRRHHHRG